MSAEPAAVFAALLAFGSLRTFDAAEAALLLVTSDFAKLFTSFPDFVDRNVAFVVQCPTNS